MADGGAEDVQDEPSGRRGRSSHYDVHIGNRVRMQRVLVGLSQERLGEAIGITFQQIQKYERGVNRIGAGRLFELSEVLGVPVGFFFEGLKRKQAAEPGASTPPNDARWPDPDSARPARAGVGRGGLREPQPEFEAENLTQRETLELVRAFNQVGDPRIRKRIIDLVRTLNPDHLEIE